MSAGAGAAAGGGEAAAGAPGEPAPVQPDDGAWLRDAPYTFDGRRALDAAVAIMGGPEPLTWSGYGLTQEGAAHVASLLAPPANVAGPLRFALDTSAAVTTAGLAVGLFGVDAEQRTGAGAAPAGAPLLPGAVALSMRNPFTAPEADDAMLHAGIAVGLLPASASVLARPEGLPEESLAAFDDLSALAALDAAAVSSNLQLPAGLRASLACGVRCRCLRQFAFDEPQALAIQATGMARITAVQAASADAARALSRPAKRRATAASSRLRKLGHTDVELSRPDRLTAQHKDFLRAFLTTHCSPDVSARMLCTAALKRIAGVSFSTLYKLMHDAGLVRSPHLVLVAPGPCSRGVEGCPGLPEGVGIFQEHWQSRSGFGLSEQANRRFVERSFFRHFPNSCLGCAAQVLPAGIRSLLAARRDAEVTLALMGAPAVPSVLLPPAHRSLGTTPANATPQHLHELLESFVREVCTQANPMRREMSACDPELSAFTRLYAAFNERLRSRQLATVVFSTFMSMIRALQMRNNMLLTRWRNNQCGPDCCIFLEQNVRTLHLAAHNRDASAEERAAATADLAAARQTQEQHLEDYRKKYDAVKFVRSVGRALAISRAMDDAEVAAGRPPAVMTPLILVLETDDKGAIRTPRFLHLPSGFPKGNVDVALFGACLHNLGIMLNVVAATGCGDHDSSEHIQNIILVVTQAAALLGDRIEGIILIGDNCGSTNKNAYSDFGALIALLVDLDIAQWARAMSHLEYHGHNSLCDKKQQ